MLRVVDENVLVVANDLTLESLGRPVRCQEADNTCQSACVEVLEDIIRNGNIVLDDESEFLDKYKEHACFSGQPGIGDAFLRFVYERGYDEAWVTRVAIREDGEFRLPASFTSSGFHDDDYLWVAAAHNAPQPCEILNACDSDYHDHEEALVAIGVVVRELCLQTT